MEPKQFLPNLQEDITGARWNQSMSSNLIFLTLILIVFLHLRLSHK
jgi:hypothetical protein